MTATSMGSLGVSLGGALVANESKNHLFLSPFFECILGLKVQFNAKLWSFYPDFLFCRNLKKISRIQHKKGHKSA